MTSNTLMMNGEMQRENGQGGLAHGATLRSTLEETLQQMNILIKENSDLKETLKHTNTSMKERFEDLASWKEKQKEERDFLEDKLQEAKGRVAALTKRNEEQRKKIQMFEGNGPESSQGVVDRSLEVEQLKAMITRLQTEKCDLVAMNSELQLKQRSDSHEDSFIEIRIAQEGELKLTKDLQNKPADPSAAYMPASEVENLKSQVMSLFEDLQEAQSKLDEAEGMKKSLQARQVTHLKVVSTTSLDIVVLMLPFSYVYIDNFDLFDGHKNNYSFNNVQRNSLIVKWCHDLEQDLSTLRAQLVKKQEVQYQNETLKLQVDSLQSMSKMEQMKTEDEKRKLIQLQDAYAKLFDDYTAVMKAMEGMKSNVSKEEMSEVNDRLIAAEEALAVKQQKIDEMKQQIFKQEQELETVSLFKAQNLAVGQSH
ncbi:UNVERIFIED_CONTAM: hypothetical protein FKN15_052422 [Acipenser sinensis]